MKKYKASAEIEDFFKEITPKIPGVALKKMFGHPAAFVNGHMFMGVNTERIILKLSENDREDFLKLKNSRLFECTPGKIWKEYVQIPEWMFKDGSTLNEWTMRSFTFISSLPPKEKKTKKR